MNSDNIIYFKDRKEAGKILARSLEKYKDRDVVVYAIPRGGVIVGVEIATYLHSPLDLIITRKIRHPINPEYAIAAIAEDGHIVGNRSELALVDEEWLEAEIEKERKEAKRRKILFGSNLKQIPARGKITILVDDGVATGLSLRAAIMELKHKNPKKIVVAIPVIPLSTAKIIKKDIDELIAIDIPTDDNFLGAVGAYYKKFPQISDEEVSLIINYYDDIGKRVFTADNKLGHDFYDLDEP